MPDNDKPDVYIIKNPTRDNVTVMAAVAAALAIPTVGRRVVRQERRKKDRTANKRAAASRKRNRR